MYDVVSFFVVTEHAEETLKREPCHFYWQIANKMTRKIVGAPFDVPLSVLHNIGQISAT